MTTKQIIKELEGQKKHSGDEAFGWEMLSTEDFAFNKALDLAIKIIEKHL